MKDHIWTIVITAAVVVILLFYAFSYTVRYDEVAVVTRFDSVRGGQAVEEPGIGFRLPLPIDRVYKYSKKLQILEDQLEEFQTSDEYAVILKTDLTWRIEEPIKFFQALRTVETAESQLQSLVRELTAVVSKYRFDQLVNNDRSQLALEQIEKEAAEQLTSKLEALNCGITIERVGIRRLILPESTTERVFERMRTTREALAERARAEGRASADTIRSDAESASERILAFANRRAQSIRAEGLQEAASYYESFKQNEELAIFLNAMESLKEILGNNTRFLLDAQQIGASDLFTTEDSQ